jgi:hypothetical protein
VGVDLANRVEDVVHGAAVGKKERVEEPDGRLADFLVALELPETLAIRLQSLETVIYTVPMAR